MIVWTTVVGAQGTLVDIFTLPSRVVQYVASAAGSHPDAQVGADRVVAPLGLRDTVVLACRALVHINTSPSSDVQFIPQLAVTFVAAVSIQTLLVLITDVSPFYTLIDIFTMMTSCTQSHTVWTFGFAWINFSLAVVSS